MDESAYQQLADTVLSRIDNAFRDVDPDQVECERAGDVLTLTFKGNKRCVINTQRPTRQMWLAANAQAWHFSFDAAKGSWLDDKRPGVELFATVAEVVKQAAGVVVVV